MKYFFILFYLIVNFNAIAQKHKEKFYFLDSNYNFLIKKENASIFLTKEKIENELYRFTYYDVHTLRALRMEHYKSENADTLNGLIVFYNSTNGKADSLGFVKNGLKNGDWLYYNSLSKKKDNYIQTKVYKNGIFTSVKNNSIFIDSNIINAKYDGNFNKFLEKKLRFPKAAKKQNVSGIVSIFFVVTTQGLLQDIVVFNSINYYLDKEAILTIRKSQNNWKPATLNGIKVISYFLQPINFVLTP